MTAVIFKVLPWPTLGIAILLFGFAPGAALRMIVLLYRRDHPRRQELIAELYAVPRIERPFWVAEQLEVAIFEGLRGRFAAESGTAELTTGRAPGSVSAAIADRLGFVPSWVREVLRAAALLGVDFTVPDLATVLGRDAADLVSAVAEARAAGVLAGSGNTLGFRHPMIWSALYEEIPAPVRAAWHRQVGRALADAGAPPDRVARQLLRAVCGPVGAAEPMDEWILHWLVQTAPLLMARAPRVAAEQLRQAVERSPVGSAHHDTLVCHLAEALFRAGDVAEAE